MKKILFILLLATTLFGQNVNYLFNKANDAYQNENFTEAIKIYENILNSGQASGKLYYNLGNAYYKTDEIGKAILFYEKSKLLLPDDENLLFNLKLANVKVKDRIQAPPDSFMIKIHKAFINIFSLGTWSIIFSLLLLITAILFLLRNLVEKLKNQSTKTTILVLILITIFTIYPMYSKYSIEELSSNGVLISAYSEVFAAPDSESTKLFNIHEGTQFHILDSDGVWLKIELIDGKQGWVPKQNCSEV